MKNFMEQFEAKLTRRNSFSIALAVVGKFSNKYREMYGEDARPSELTSFCLKLMLAYDGEEISLNDERFEQIWVKCMEQSRAEYIMLSAPFQKLMEWQKMVSTNLPAK